MFVKPKPEMIGMVQAGHNPVYRMPDEGELEIFIPIRSIYSLCLRCSYVFFRGIYFPPVFARN
jgi:hypothetical protein